MIHQKGRESFEESNWNENPKEAQESKKEGPPLAWRKKDKKERTRRKEEGKETQKKGKK